MGFIPVGNKGMFSGGNSPLAIICFGRVGFNGHSTGAINVLLIVIL